MGGAEKRGNKKDMGPEKGIVFFSRLNASRLYDIIPENALERTNKKFISRFEFLERRAREAGRSLKEMTLAEMDLLWEESKGLEAES